MDRKKYHATSQDKKNTQPLGTKKNHATSQQKKSWNHLGQTKSRSFWGQKGITQPLKTKKKNHPINRSDFL